MLVKKIILSVILTGMFLSASMVSASSSADCQNLMKAINDFPLGGKFNKVDYLITNGSDISDNLWLFQGNLGKTALDISEKKADMTNRQLEFKINSQEDFFDDLVAVINNLYRKPTSISETPSEKKYIWLYDNYKAVLQSKVKDDFTYDISFIADWNYLGHYSAVSSENNPVYKSFVKAINDLQLQAQFNKPEYLLSNGSDISNNFWFYKGNLGQNKIDVRVRQADLMTRKVEITTTVADDFAYDMVFAISNIYYQPTSVAISQSEQKYIWEYYSYKITFNSKLNENFKYDVSFTAECK